MFLLFIEVLNFKIKKIFFISLLKIAKQCGARLDKGKVPSKPGS